MYVSFLPLIKFFFCLKVKIYIPYSYNVDDETSDDIYTLRTYSREQVVKILNVRKNKKIQEFFSSKKSAYAYPLSISNYH